MGIWWGLPLLHFLSLTSTIPIESVLLLMYYLAGMRYNFRGNHFPFPTIMTLALQIMKWIWNSCQLLSMCISITHLGPRERTTLDLLWSGSGFNLSLASLHLHFHQEVILACGVSWKHISSDPVFRSPQKSSVHFILWYLLLWKMAIGPFGERLEETPLYVLSVVWDGPF